MKALTICQPYAHLICVTKEKRVENRVWHTRHRGELLIHAGLSREWLTESYAIPATDMVFGAIIGKVNVVACYPRAIIDTGQYDDEYPWLKKHEHATGPFCWVLADPVIFDQPIPFSGKQKLFDVPDSLLVAQGIAA